MIKSRFTTDYPFFLSFYWLNQGGQSPAGLERRGGVVKGWWGGGVWLTGWGLREVPGVDSRPTAGVLHVVLGAGEARPWHHPLLSPIQSPVRKGRHHGDSCRKKNHIIKRRKFLTHIITPPPKKTYRKCSNYFLLNCSFKFIWYVRKNEIF